MDLIPLLNTMIKAKASDIFVVAGQTLAYEAGDRITRLEGDMLTPADTKEVVKAIYELADRDFRLMEENVNHDEDFSFAVPGVGRFRANVFRQRGSMSAIIRVIPFGLPNPEELGVTEEVLSL